MPARVADTILPRPCVALAGAALVALIGCAGAPAAEPSAQPDSGGCTVDLLVQFSPQIPRPSSPAFLQELVRGSGYHLRYVRTLGTTLLLRLAGPDTTCENGIALLRRHPTVKSLDLDERQYRHVVRPPEP
jgi:hypothetical protein